MNSHLTRSIPSSTHTHIGKKYIYKYITHLILSIFWNFIILLHSFNSRKHVLFYFSLQTLVLMRKEGLLFNFMLLKAINCSNEIKVKKAIYMYGR